MSALLALISAAAAQQPCLSRDIDGLNRAARSSLFAVNFGDAYRLSQRAIEALPCHDRHISPQQLASVYQSGAVIALKYGATEDAQAWMADALRMAPGVDYDASLGEDGEALYAAARAALDPQLLAEVFTSTGLLLDGWYLPPGERRVVTPGAHLLQWHDESTIVTEQVFVEGGAPLQIGPPAPDITPPTATTPRRSPVLALGGGLAATTGVLLLAWPAAQSWSRTGWYEPHDGYQQQAADFRSRAIGYTAAGTLLVSAGTATMLWSLSAAPTPQGGLIQLTGAW